MTVGEIAHDLAWLLYHEHLVLPVIQCEIHGTPDVLGVCEENGSLTDRKVGSRLQAVLSRPRVNGLEQNLVRVEASW
jgi:hypothetical protein